MNTNLYNWLNSNIEKIFIGGKILLDREENLKWSLLEIKRLKLLKKIKDIENTIGELYESKKQLKNKLQRVESLEKKALNEMIKQLNFLDEIENEINLLRANSFKSPIETLVEIKSSFSLEGVKTIDRF